MSKMRAILLGATAAGALAASSFVPAHADDVIVPGVGVLTVVANPSGSGEITANGDDGNGAYAGGYITAYGSADGSGDICADDMGSPGDEGGTPTCVSSVAP